MPLKGGRRTSIERREPKCNGALDGITKDYIPPEFAIRLFEDGHHYCYDVRSLHAWFKTGSRINPLTNIQFSRANLAKIKLKFQKVGLGASPRPSPRRSPTRSPRRISPLENDMEEFQNFLGHDQYDWWHGWWR